MPHQPEAQARNAPRFTVVSTSPVNRNVSQLAAPPCAQHSPINISVYECSLAVCCVQPRGRLRPRNFASLRTSPFICLMRESRPTPPNSLPNNNLANNPTPQTQSIPPSPTITVRRKSLPTNTFRIVAQNAPPKTAQKRPFLAPILASTPPNYTPPLQTFSPAPHPNTLPRQHIRTSSPTSIRPPLMANPKIPSAPNNALLAIDVTPSVTYTYVQPVIIHAHHTPECPRTAPKQNT